MTDDNEKERAARVLAEAEAERLRLLTAQRAADLETARREQESVDREENT